MIHTNYFSISKLQCCNDALLIGSIFNGSLHIHDYVLIIIGWDSSEKAWNYSSTIQAESFAVNYTLALKERLQKRKSLSL